MKAQVHQLRVELKTIKKGNRPVSEFLLLVRAIIDSLFSIGDPIGERDQVDAILHGLSKEYTSFIMMMYEKVEPADIYEVEALLYVQYAQMEKYEQELVTPSATAKIAHTDNYNYVGRNADGYSYYRG